MVGRVVLPLRFNLSQALCVCLVVFQVCKSDEGLVRDGQGIRK